MYSGRQPAITPFTATLKIVAVRLSGSNRPNTSSGSRSVNARNSRTFSMVGGTIGKPSLQPFSRNRRLTSSKVPSNRISRGSGSCIMCAAGGCSVRLRITSSTVTLSTLSRNSASVCTSTCPGTLAKGRFGIPRPDEVVPAWPTNPSQTRDDEGTPAISAAALARNTAGVQLPQQPMPEMTASVPVDFILSARPATTACSSPPWVEPKTS